MILVCRYATGSYADRRFEAEGFVAAIGEERGDRGKAFAFAHQVPEHRLVRQAGPHEDASDREPRTAAAHRRGAERARNVPAVRGEVRLHFIEARFPGRG